MNCSSLKQQTETESQVPVFDPTESKIVNSLTAGLTGKVSKVSDGIIEVSAFGEAVLVVVPENARITFQELGREPQIQEGEFEEIKEGDGVYITAKIKEDGTFEASKINISDLYITEFGL